VTPKERRDRLFKKDRPLVRRLEVMDGEQYSKDMGILWAAYQAKSFPDLPEGLTPEQFTNAVDSLQSKYDQVWIIDDNNGAFKDRKGPVAMACTNSQGLLVNAEGTSFKWASRKNILKASAAFINMVRHSEKTGVLMVKANEAGVGLCWHLKKYGLLFYVGKVSKDEHLFSHRGRGSD